MYIICVGTQTKILMTLIYFCHACVMYVQSHQQFYFSLDVFKLIKLHNTQNIQMKKNQTYLIMHLLHVLMCSIFI